MNSYFLKQIIDITAVKVINLQIYNSKGPNYTELYSTYT